MHVSGGRFVSSRFRAHGGKPAVEMVLRKVTFQGERGALTHSHDSERSSLCSQRGSLARALSSLRSVSPSLRSAHRFALLLSFFATSPVFALENRFDRPRFRPSPRHKSLSPEQSDHTHRSAREQRNFLSLCERVGMVCYVGLVCGTFLQGG